MNDYKKGSKPYTPKNKNEKKDKSGQKELNYREEIIKIFGDDFENQILNENKQSYNDYIDRLKLFTKSIYEDISTSQLRNVFYEVKKSTDPKQIYIMRPKFAYISGRTDNRKEGMKIFLFLLDELAKNVDNEKKLTEFKNFFESIISYHKYFGGKD